MRVSSSGILNEMRSVPCRNGAGCRFLRQGFCIFCHPSIQGNNYIYHDRNNYLNSHTSHNRQPNDMVNYGHNYNEGLFMFTAHQQENKQIRREVSQNVNNQRHKKNNRNRRRRLNARRAAQSFSDTQVIPKHDSTNTQDFKLIQSSYEKQELDTEIHIDALNCPIGMEIMMDPVVAADGHTYERCAIEKWLVLNDRSPMNNTRLKHKNLIPNYALKKCIIEWSALKPLFQATNPK